MCHFIQKALAYLVHRQALKKRNQNFKKHKAYADSFLK